MRNLIVSWVMFLSVATVAQGKTVNTRVYQILYPKKAGAPVTVLVEQDAKTYQVPSQEHELISRLLDGQKSGHYLKLTHEGRRITDVTDLGKPPVDPLLGSSGISRGEPRFSTNFSSYGEVLRIFKKMDSMKRKSQCFRRAQWWSHQLWSEEKVVTSKVFVFFTQRFIQNTNYKWWFHVAPYVRYRGKVMVLDPTFAKVPLPLEEWKSLFMGEEQECPVVSHYDDYFKNQDSSDCYLRLVNMYYYQPADIETHDRAGTQPDQWSPFVLRNMKRAKYRFPSYLYR